MPSLEWLILILVVVVAKNKTNAYLKEEDKMDLTGIDLRINEKYPEIKDAVRCPKTVSVLKDLLSARGGELHSVLQFIFQSTQADKTNADIGALFEEMGIINMRHLGLLMHAITDFGGVPKYEDCAQMPFNINCVNYSLKLKDMLDADIMLTKESIKNYKTASTMVKNESLISLFARIIKDKEKQLKALKKVKDSVQFLSA